MRKNISDPFPLTIQSYFHKPKNPILTTLKDKKFLILLCTLIIAFHASGFYFVFVYFPKAFTYLSRSEVPKLLQNSYFILLHIIFIPILAYFVDKIGALKSLVIAQLFQLFLIFPCYHFLLRPSADIFWPLFFLSISTALNAAVVPGFICSIIPTQTRGTITAFSFNLSFGIFGGLTPSICLYLVAKYDCIYLSVFYLMGVTAVSLAATAYLVLGIKNDIKRLCKN